jgi:H+/gluconate symporter-like permease
MVLNIFVQIGKIINITTLRPKKKSPIGLTMKVALVEMKADMFSDITIGMILGMVLGMVASPLMMKAIKQRRRVSRMLRQAAELQKAGQSSYKYQTV